MAWLHANYCKRETTALARHQDCLLGQMVLVANAWSSRLIGMAQGMRTRLQMEGLCLPKSTFCSELLALACNACGRYPSYAQLHFWHRRENGTSRPGRSTFAALDEDPRLTLEAYALKTERDRCPKTGMYMRVVFLEEIEEAAWPFVSCTLGCLLFLKLLDLGRQEIRVSLSQPKADHTADGVSIALT